MGQILNGFGSKQTPHEGLVLTISAHLEDEHFLCKSRNIEIPFVTDSQLLSNKTNLWLSLNVSAMKLAFDSDSPSTRMPLFKFRIHKYFSTTFYSYAFPFVSSPLWSQDRSQDDDNATTERGRRNASLCFRDDFYCGRYNLGDFTVERWKNYNEIVIDCVWLYKYLKLLCDPSLSW